MGNTDDTWVLDINRKLNERKRNRLHLESCSPCIFKVPPNLFDIQKSAFLPKIISIGPFHRNVDTMHHQKMGFFLRVLEDNNGEISRSKMMKEEIKFQSCNMGSEIQEEPEEESKHDACNMGSEIQEEPEEESKHDACNMGSEKDEETKSHCSSNICLDNLVRAIQDLEQKTRECYSRPCDDLSRSDFIRMMIIDGCFVIDLLCLHKTLSEIQTISGGAGVFNWLFNRRYIFDDEYDNPIITTRWLLRSLQCDIIKLENQIPYFVLEELFSLTESGSVQASLQDLFETFFGSIWLQGTSFKLSKKMDYPQPLDDFRSRLRQPFKTLCKTISSEDESINLSKYIPREDYAHPLDHFRSILIPRGRKPPKWEDDTKKKIRLIYSAEQLQEAGVSFMKEEDSNPLDIRFDSRKGVLKIPQLSINEITTTLLLNFVAYEQCNQNEKPYFINYLLFLDSLINTTKDAEILHKHGILRYTLGTEKEVADLFNNFCKEVTYDFDHTYLFVDMEAVNKYCKAFYGCKCRIWWSNLIKERFSSPWTCLSLFAATLLLLLTMLQTFYTVFPYYHPKKG